MDFPFDASEDFGLNNHEDGDVREIASTQEEEINKDSDTLLIETVHNFPALYNKELKDYHDSEIRRNCWTNIAETLNKEVADCQKRWNQLRDSFTCERRRRQKDERSGSGKMKRKGFALYESMSFLHKHKKTKKTFTNASPAPLLHPFLMDVPRYCGPLPMRTLPLSRSTTTFCTNKSVSDTQETNSSADNEMHSFFRLPPTPPSNTSTPQPAPNTESCFVFPQTPPQPPSSSTVLQISTPELETPVTTDASSSSSCKEADRSSVFNRSQCIETSSRSGFENSPIHASSTSTPPPRAPTPTTPSSRPLSPRSPFSTCSDVSYTYSDSSQFSLPSPNIPFEKFSSTESRYTPPKKCYTKDNRVTKKVDPVEKSFSTLSAALQEHFTQKKVVQQSDTKKTATSDGEEAFGSLVAIELKKMDAETQKIKKTRILQILYE